MGTRPLGRMLLCQEEEEENTEASVVPTPLGPLRETYCQKHSEKIYFFCKTDAEFLCVFCRAGPAHRTHSMGFLDEAIRPYRDHLRSQLEVLRVKRDKIENIKCREDQKLQGLLALIENKKQQVETAFERLYQELGDQQRLLLARMRGLEQQIWKERDEYITKVSKEVAQVEAQVEELKQKCQRPGSELVQDVRVYQSRCEKTFVNPEAISSDLAKKILELHRKILILPDMMKTFSENLVQHLETDSGN
uniref:tripartite motif-containing protein 15 n=1 Tax=Jaculus jaculus TaxID=51337 RepID=UPI001E1B384A|nr:tripartite motif-containing protein 15 [Jaculus jaculus]